jgi:hypothetical protein
MYFNTLTTEQVPALAAEQAGNPAAGSTEPGTTIVPALLATPNQPS